MSKKPTYKEVLEYHMENGLDENEAREVIDRQNGLDMHWEAIQSLRDTQKSIEKIVRARFNYREKIKT